MGANNPRKPFGAELADPYANADEVARPHVDAALRVVCKVRIMLLITCIFMAQNIPNKPTFNSSYEIQPQPRDYLEIVQVQMMKCTWNF